MGFLSRLLGRDSGGKYEGSLLAIKTAYRNDDIWGAQKIVFSMPDSPEKVSALKELYGKINSLSEISYLFGFIKSLAPEMRATIIGTERFRNDCEKIIRAYVKNNAGYYDAAKEAASLIDRKLTRDELRTLIKNGAGQGAINELNSLD
ncbi:MAG: hypothetical protein LLG04_17630 [Parachlamydia sp.]|nr:hypothetical protein [Parachlamydia sp.]